MNDGRQVVELTSEFFRIGSSSFTDFASRVAPDVLPLSRTAAPGSVTWHRTAQRSSPRPSLAEL